MISEAQGPIADSTWFVEITIPQPDEMDFYQLIYIGSDLNDACQWLEAHAAKFKGYRLEVNSVDWVNHSNFGARAWKAKNSVKVDCPDNHIDYIAGCMANAKADFMREHPYI